jgi:drug/metabolite transporter (DMT)-like permease
MKRHPIVVLVMAGVGVLTVVVGGGLTQSRPNIHEAIRVAGLLLMLLSAAIFLAASYAGSLQEKRRRRPTVASGALETARNLMIAGGSLFGGALAVCLALRWIVPAGSLIFWMLGALMLVGAAALVIGAFAYTYALIFGTSNAARTRENA